MDRIIQPGQESVRRIGVQVPMPGVVYPPPAALERHVRQGALSFETLAGAIIHSFERHADRIALTGPRGDVTYREFDALTDRLGAALVRLGVQPLERAIFQMANDREVLIAAIACLKVGVIPVCTLVTHREVEIRALGNHSAATIWFIDGDDEKFDLRDFAAAEQAAIPSVKHVIVARGAPRPGQRALEALIEAESPDASRALVRRIACGLDPFQAAVFQLSGGTTGVSKIIPRFSNEYLANMRNILSAAERVSPESAPEVVFSGGPHMHNAGFVCHWGPGLLIGSRILITRDYTEDGLLDAFLRYRPTWAFVPKPLLLRLVAAKRRRDIGLPSLKHVATLGGVPIIRDEIGARPVSVFGMAEGPVMITRPDDPLAMLEETVGRTIAPQDEIHLVEPGTLNEVPDGTMGELVVRGPCVLHGYYRADEKNRESFSDGFLRTGDLMLRKIVGGRLFYLFQGRIKDIVKRAGETISCEEIERVLRAGPGIADVAVVPVSDPVYIERACACLILQPGASAPSVTTLNHYLATTGLAKFKWPEHVHVFDVFPTTKSGKLSKPLLRQEAEARIAAASKR